MLHDLVLGGPAVVAAVIRLGENGLAVLNLSEVKRAHVLWVLEYCGGEVRWAARELGVNETTVNRWLRRWGKESS